jgi:RinA family phage transcriptional activator
MKYKFDLSPSIKNTVEWQLQYYQEDKRQLESMKTDLIPSTVQGYSLTAGVDGGEAKRTTEEITMQVIGSPYIRRLELTCEAIGRALKNFDKVDMRLIELVYWKREYTVEGAGMKIGLSKSAAYQRINKILGCVAYELGYVSIR